MTIFVFSSVLLFIEAHINGTILEEPKKLAQSFRAAYPKLPFVTLKEFHLLEKHFKQGIAAYSVTNAGDFILN